MLLEKNFIASAVSLRLVSWTFAVDDASDDEETGKKKIAAGTIVTGSDSNVVGVATNDIYFETGEETKIGSLIVAGHLFTDRLPAEPTAEQITAFAAKGLFFETAPETELPEDGTLE